MKSPLVVTQVVRRFGLFGGMESYVYHLSQALLDRGIRVHVICEKVQKPLSGVTFHRVCEPLKERPRWRAMLHFREQVSALLGQAHWADFGIIHSHERSIKHHVTTFHGPPIELGLWSYVPQWLNPRISAWRRMESDELRGDSVKAVIPVSHLIGSQLLKAYPDIAPKLAFPGWPAPNYVPQSGGQAQAPLASSVRLGFVGREWKRKGLPKAYRIMRSLRQIDQKVKLIVVGAENIPVEIANDPDVEYVNWTEQVPFNRMDILVHPALKEPYGMVVAEARAAGLPVLCSDQVGAAGHGFKDLEALPLGTSDAEWAAAVMSMCAQKSRPQTLINWRQLADQTITSVYRPLLCNSKDGVGSNVREW